MKTKLILLSLATTLLSSCYHTTVKDNVLKDCGESFRGVEYTNTSKSKYVEVTIKYYNEKLEEYGIAPYTKTIKLKPGEIISECEENYIKIKIVGEREITENN